MTTKEKAYPYLKNSTIEKESAKLLESFCKDKGQKIVAPVPVFDIIEHLGYDVDFRKDGIYEDKNLLGGTLIDQKTIEINEIVFLETADGDRHRYRVAQIDVVHESATEVVQQDGVKRLTLITCYPFDAITPGGPLRYVVRAFGEFTEDGTPFPVAS